MLKFKKITKCNLKKVTAFFKNSKDKYFKKIYKNSLLTTTTNKPYKPILLDLYNLYHLIVKNKKLCVLEFGCGWSSLVINKALEYNKKKLSKSSKHLNRINKFKHFSVDNDKKFISIAKKRLPNNKISIFISSSCKVELYNGQISHGYNALPDLIPDFIYIDGPDVDRIMGKAQGISFKRNKFDKVPMGNDILKIEHLLYPGTIMLIDGRDANVRFLKNNLKRKWKYFFERNSDQHTLFLDEKPLGKYNKEQLVFYKHI